MDVTIQISKDWATSPLQVLEMDIDTVIMFINYLLDYKETHSEPEEKAAKEKDNFWNF